MNTKRKFTKILSYQGVKAVVRRCSVKKEFLEISQNSQENTCVRISFLIKLKAKACNFIKKETLTQVFPCEFFEISKNTFFAEHIWTTDSASQTCKIGVIQTWRPF